MSRSLILALSAEEDGPVLWGIGRESGVDRTGRLASAAELGTLPLHKVDEVIAVVPGCDVLSRSVTLAAKREREIRTALPYLIEDEVSKDPEDLHFALGPEGEGNARRVAVVSREAMERWQRLLAPLGDKPCRIVADFDVLRAPDAGVRVVDRGDRVIVLPAGGLPVTADKALAPMVLPDLVRGADHVSVESSDPSAFSGVFAGGTGGAALATHPALSDGAFFGEALEAARGGTLIDLLQGSFARGVRWSLSPALWRRAAILAGVTALAYLISLGIQGWQYHRMADGLTARTETAFRAAFPEVRRVVNPLAQMNAKLAALQGAGSDRFLRLSSVLFTGVEGLPAIEIRDMRFNADRGKLRASLVYRSFKDLEDLKAAVAREGGLLEEGGSRQSGDRMIGDVTIGLP